MCVDLYVSDCAYMFVGVSEYLSMLPIKMRVIEFGYYIIYNVEYYIIYENWIS